MTATGDAVGSSRFEALHYLSQLSELDRTGAGADSNQVPYVETKSYLGLQLKGSEMALETGTASLEVNKVGVECQNAPGEEDTKS